MWSNADGVNGRARRQTWPITTLSTIAEPSVGRDSSVGIATRCWLDGQGIESRWGGGARFSAPGQTGPGAYPASYTMGTGSFPGVKRPERDVDHPPPSSAGVKERVELYLYPPPLWAFEACSRGNFTFIFTVDLSSCVLYQYFHTISLHSPFVYHVHLY